MLCIAQKARQYRITLISTEFNEPYRPYTLAITNEAHFENMNCLTVDYKLKLTIKIVVLVSPKYDGRYDSVKFGKYNSYSIVARRLVLR